MLSTWQHSGMKYKYTRRYNGEKNIPMIALWCHRSWLKPSCSFMVYPLFLLLKIHVEQCRAQACVPLCTMPIN